MVDITDTTYIGCHLDGSDSAGGAIFISGPYTVFSCSSCEFADCLAIRGGAIAIPLGYEVELFAFTGTNCQATSGAFVSSTELHQEIGFAMKIQESTAVLGHASDYAFSSYVSNDFPAVSSHINFLNSSRHDISGNAAGYYLGYHNLLRVTFSYFHTNAARNTFNLPIAYTDGNLVECVSFFNTTRSGPTPHTLFYGYYDLTVHACIFQSISDPIAASVDDRNSWITFSECLFDRLDWTPTARVTLFTQSCITDAPGDITFDPRSCWLGTPLASPTVSKSILARTRPMSNSLPATYERGPTTPGELERMKNDVLLAALISVGAGAIIALVMWLVIRRINRAGPSMGNRPDIAQAQLETSDEPAPRIVQI
jgi:hypothetical protein